MFYSPLSLLLLALSICVHDDGHLAQLLFQNWFSTSTSFAFPTVRKELKNYITRTVDWSYCGQTLTGFWRIHMSFISKWKLSVRIGGYCLYKISMETEHSAWPGKHQDDFSETFSPLILKTMSRFWGRWHTAINFEVSLNLIPLPEEVWRKRSLLIAENTIPCRKINCVTLQWDARVSLS